MKGYIVAAGPIWEGTLARLFAAELTEGEAAKLLGVDQVVVRVLADYRAAAQEAAARAGELRALHQELVNGWMAPTRAGRADDPAEVRAYRSGLAQAAMELQAGAWALRASRGGAGP